MSAVTKYVSDARISWNLLNGVFLVYKPTGMHLKTLRTTVTKLLCKDLNEMKVRPPIDYIRIEGDTTQPMDVTVQKSYADHPLVVGPRYQPQDFRMSFANLMSTNSSGVVVCGINNGTKTTFKIKQASPTRFYKLKGILGQATNNYFISGKVVEKSTYKHVKRNLIDKVCSSMQASHQRKMFELSGVDIQSQAAYELALKGPIRPANPDIPMVYTIKCVDFTPPEFTLEIVCINEYEMYLKTIIHEIGMQLHTTATCMQVQCTKFGVFHVNDALLSKHWCLQHIINNIQNCKKIIKENPFVVKQESALLVKANVQ